MSLDHNSDPGGDDELTDNVGHDDQICEVSSDINDNHDGEETTNVAIAAEYFEEYVCVEEDETSPSN